MFIQDFAEFFHEIQIRSGWNFMEVQEDGEKLKWLQNLIPMVW